MIDSGDTAWILVSTALVLFMSLPGLALFYGGLVQARNVLSVLMHVYAIACLMSLLWLAGAYSLAFADGSNIIGGLGKGFLLGVDANAPVSGTKIPEGVFFIFQMTFAIITPALIVGAYVERIRFAAVLSISALWLVFVYAPVTHWIWGGGWLGQMGIMDFAGGLVVHLTAGVSALVIVALLGARAGFPEDSKPPHAPGMTMAGASMLWVGWFGFNGGSALAAGGGAGMAILVTHIAAAMGSLVWLAIEWMKYGKPSLVGIVTGTIAGLATITPASGFVGPLGGVLLGLAGGLVCYWAVTFVKMTVRLDDSLDVFAVHGVGGLLGTLLVAFLAHEALGGAGYAEGQNAGGQFLVQLAGAAATAAWSVIATIVIVMVTQTFFGLRVSREEETEGLDFTAHGETAYHQ